MSYLDHNLLPDEQIIFRTKKSLVIFSFPFSLLCVGLIVGYVLMFVVPMLPALQNVITQFSVGKAFLIAIFAVTAITGFKVWLEYHTSEFAVTNRRLVMREGFFVRHTSETRLTAISHVSVVQSLAGQLMNYGNVSINSFGGSADTFTQISAPIVFQREVHSQLDKLVR